MESGKKEIVKELNGNMKFYGSDEVRFSDELLQSAHRTIWLI